jgi:hypothetical protein
MTSRAFGAPRRLTFHSCRSAIDSRSGAALALAVLALWIIAVVDSSPSGGSDDPNTVPDVYRGISDRDQTGSAGSPREPVSERCAGVGGFPQHLH